MPKYDYKCGACGHVTEEHRTVTENHRAPGQCSECKEATEFVFPTGGFSLWTFQPGYDEGVDMDIHSRGEKKQILKAMGLQEAGDKVGGARNFDKSGEYVRAQQPLTGRTYDTVMREKEEARKAADWTIGVETKGGGTIVKKASQLPGPKPKKNKLLV